MKQKILKKADQSQLDKVLSGLQFPNKSIISMDGYRLKKALTKLKKADARSRHK